MYLIKGTTFVKRESKRINEHCDKELPIKDYKKQFTYIYTYFSNEHYLR